MAALASDLRKTLESSVVKARDLAERGARDALTALAVGASEPFSSMGDEERKLRNRLRAHGRQLGDERDPQKKTQSIERLVREMAYEHWHRMLFARFLAENQLLIEPTSGVSISLDECEELAAEEGTDLWGLAAQFAQEMLPQIFRLDDPVLEAKLPLEIRQQLQALLLDMPADVFQADDSLGWTYQYWQSAEKERVNTRVRSGEKITSESLPAVTQLFTEDYMVRFLLDNTVGAWYANRNLSKDQLRNASSEVELREQLNKTTLGAYKFDYLRFARIENGQAGTDEQDTCWQVAGIKHEDDPRSIASLRVLDPCCGSGHFLVGAFNMLVQLRIAEEGLDIEDAIAHVISENLFGLEIDHRCTQLAAFNVAFAAWRLAGKVIKLPQLQIACSGIGPQISKSEWLCTAEASAEWSSLSSRDRQLVTNGLTELYDAFSQAPNLGSLLTPAQRKPDIFTADFDALEPFLTTIHDQDSSSDDIQEQAIAARGMTLASKILAHQFDLVITNFPFLGFGKQNANLLDYLKRNYALGFRELAIAFLLRSRFFVNKYGSCACVLPSDWTHSPTTAKLRQSLLASGHFDFICFCGGDAFSTPLRTSPVLLSFTYGGQYSHSFTIDLSKSSFNEKGASLKSGEIIAVNPASWKGNPSSRIIFDTSFGSAQKRLGDYAEAKAGVSAGDGVRFERQFWEVMELGDKWALLQGPPEKTGNFTGRSTIIRWEKERGQIRELAESVKHLNHIAQNWQRGRPFWGGEGIVLSQFGAASIYTGEIFDCRCFVVKPREKKHLPALIDFALKGRLMNELKTFDSGFAFRSPKALLDIPFNVDTALIEPPVLAAGEIPQPYTRNPAQWIFHGCPDLEESELTLNVAVARLLGYKWPAEIDANIKLSSKGLRLVERSTRLSRHVDNDGIACLSPIRGEASAADRIRELLVDALEVNWDSQLERRLLLEEAIGGASKKQPSCIEDWLRDNFFIDHCRLFEGRPFIWHVWDGNPTGFSALVNYHKLAAGDGIGLKTLEQLTYTYLGDWIDRQRLDQADGVNGADSRLAAALDLQSQLKMILEGEPPYDIFVRWKPLHQQPIGWAPDIDDGIRVNIRPFLKAQLRHCKSASGVLRAKPGAIKWSKDRGKEPFGTKEHFPWFWGWDENDNTLATDFGAPIPGAPPAGNTFDGNRWNDLHYSRAAKIAAKARKQGEG